MSRFRQRISSIFLVQPSGSVAEFDWPAQSPGYQTALLRHAGYGMDSYGGSGRDGASGRQVVFFQDDFTNGSAVQAAYPGGYMRIYHGNAEGLQYLRTTGGITGPCAMIPIGSGYVNKRDDWRPQSYFDYYGQFAPGDGVIWRETQPSTVIDFAPTNASHQRFWHMDIRAGDTTGGIASGARDAAATGGSSPSGAGGGGQVVWINCLFSWSLDEIVDGYYALGNGLLTFTYCVFAEPLHKSIHDDTGTPDDGIGVDSHGYGPIMGEGYRWDKICFSRNLFAHSYTRNPEVAATKLAGANNLIYNAADTSGSDGFGLILTVDYDASSPTATAMLTNWTDNLYLSGPDSTATLNPVYHPAGTAQPAGSQGYLAGNVASGYTFAAQSDLVTGSPPASWLQGSLLTTSWPAGWGTAREGTYRITTSASPNGATPTEILNFATVLCASVGPRPSISSTKSRARTVAGHVLARLSGSGDQGATVNSVAGTSDPSGWPNVALRFSPNAGDWPSLSSLTIDPFSPGSYWHAAMPLNGTEPDDRVLTTGTFSNGLSKAGYTAIEAWAIEQHYYVGGQ